MAKLSEADLRKLSLAQLGSKTGRLLNSSSKVNKFLNGQFTVPKVFESLDVWFDKQSFGIADKTNIELVVKETKTRDIDLEVKKAASEFEVIQLTKQQENQLPAAIEAYRGFLVKVMDGVKSTGNYINSKSDQKKPVTEKQTAKKETQKVEVEA